MLEPCAFQTLVCVLPSGRAEGAPGQTDCILSPSSGLLVASWYGLGSNRVWGLSEEQGVERSRSRYPCLAESYWQHIFPSFRKEGKVKEGPMDQGSWSHVSIYWLFSLASCFRGNIPCVAWDPQWNGTCCVCEGLGKKTGFTKLVKN